VWRETLSDYGNALQPKKYDYETLCLWQFDYEIVRVVKYFALHIRAPILMWTWTLK